MGGRSVFISVRALGGIYQNDSTEIYTGKQSFTNLDEIRGLTTVVYLEELGIWILEDWRARGVA